MSNVEILGRPKYFPMKDRLLVKFNPMNQLKSPASKLSLTYEDLVYERDSVFDEDPLHKDGSLEG